MFNFKKFKNSSIINSLFFLCIYISLFYATFISMTSSFWTDNGIQILKRCDFYCFLISFLSFVIIVNMYYNHKNKCITKISIILLNVYLLLNLYFINPLLLYISVILLNVGVNDFTFLFLIYTIPFLFTSAFIWSYATHHKKTFATLLIISILFLPNTLKIIGIVIDFIFPYTPFIEE